MSKLDDLIIPHLRKEEGCVLHAYQDSLGYWTIGYGHLIDRRKGGQIPQQMAENLLLHDVKAKKAEISAKLPFFERLDPVRQAVLLSMAFQMGISGLLSFKNTLRCVETGDYSGAAGRMLLSRWATQTPGRALRLSRAMATGKEEYLV